MMDPMRTLADIWNIVHKPTSKTSHKGAMDHFASDFDAIRARIKPFIDAGFLDPKTDGSNGSSEISPRG